ncbi:MAG: hypothetical protein R3B68_08815 [Phycisphaerales bacterium]
MRRAPRAHPAVPAPIVRIACVALAAMALAWVGARQPEDGGLPTVRRADGGVYRIDRDDAGIRFVAFDVLIDPRGLALAAYQVEIVGGAGGDGAAATLVGVEGGDGAYAAAPYYDPEALHSTPVSDDENEDDEARPPERIVLAGLAGGVDGVLAGGVEAPVGEWRVARLHVMVEGGGEPVFAVRLIVAGADERTAIEAAVRLVPAEIPDP